MLDDMLGYIENIRERPVWQPIPDDIRARFHESPPLAPSRLAEVHQQFMTTVLPYTAANSHPGFMGWVQGGGTPVGMLAEMLSAGLNANTGGRDQVPLEVERQVARWMRSLFGFPETASGIVLSGTSMANFVAVVVARDAALSGVRQRGLGTQLLKLTAYASTAVHGCVAKALDLAGLGGDSLRLIATDPHGRIDLNCLASTIAEDRAAGFTPFLAVGTAGTVDIGAIDDLNGLADLSAREHLWFHVDGALGALAILAPSLAPRLRGIERADSLAFDFHKWAQVPYDAGFLLVRDGALHQQAFASPAAYLGREDRGLAAGSPWPCDLGPELSRGFRALKVWVALKVYGTDAIGAVIARSCELAQYLKSRVETTPELELMAPVGLNIVCFRYRFDRAEAASPELSNQLNRELVIRLQESGIVAPSATMLQGRAAVRAAIVNHRTSRFEIDSLMEATMAIGAEIKLKKTPVIPIGKLRQPHFATEGRVQQITQQLDAGKPLFKALEISLRIERAMLLAHLGRPLEARSDHLRILELDETHHANLLELGRLLIRTGHRKAAQVVYEQAVQHYPKDVIARVNLGSAMLEGDDPFGARQHYEVALSIDPELPQAHGGMYYALTRLGERDAAALHRQKAFGRKNLFQSPYRGSAPPISIILLVSSTGGNTPIEKLLDDTIFETWVLVADFFEADTPLPKHQLVFNGIGDVDIATEALVAAKALIGRTSAPVLNMPSAVLATGRCENATRLAELPGVLTARTGLYPCELLTSPDGIPDGQGGPTVLASEGYSFPLLLRVPGFHMGQHFVEVDSPASLAAQVARLPGSDRPGAELLVIEYLDARGEDGCFRKYRVMMVDGQLYPLHLAISPNWKIHYFSADMADRPDHREEEEEFLTDMAAVLGPRAMAGLEAIRATLGLDYGGIDFGISRHGEVLLFEANANMVVEQPADDPRWDYRRTAVEQIHAAVRGMLMKNLKSTALITTRASMSGKD